MSLVIEGVSVDLDGRRILHDISAVVPEGETLAVLGPSGSGKSTLLRAVAGLAPITSGRITFNGRDLAEVPVHTRNFGVVFQAYALFDHLDVAGNVAFGPRMAGLPRSEVSVAVADALDRVGLTGFDERTVETLSGGERQRVALARALVTDPTVLLLDEPLGAVDAALKEHLLGELLQVVAERTALYITHDHDEAMTIGDRVALLRDGHLVASDTPDRLWLAPPDPWSARFLGHPNVYDDGGPFGATAMMVPERAIEPDPTGPLTVSVDSVRFAGDGWRITAHAGSHPVVFKHPEPIPLHSWIRLSWSDQHTWEPNGIG